MAVRSRLALLRLFSLTLALSVALYKVAVAETIVTTSGIGVGVGRGTSRLGYGPVVQFIEHNHVKFGAAINYRFGRVQIGLLTTLHAGLRPTSPTLTFGYRLSR